MLRPPGLWAVAPNCRTHLCSAQNASETHRQKTLPTHKKHAKTHSTHRKQSTRTQDRWVGGRLSLAALLHSTIESSLIILILNSWIEGKGGYATWQAVLIKRLYQENHSSLGCPGWKQLNQTHWRPTPKAVVVLSIQSTYKNRLSCDVAPFSFNSTI